MTKSDGFGSLVRCARSTILTGLSLSLAAPWATAQELEPRSYFNVPVGSNFLILGAFHTAGSVLPDPTSPLEDVDASIQGLVLGYGRILNMGGKSGKVSIAQPWACFEGTGVFMGEAGERDVCGLSDTTVRVNYNFLGAPALTWSEFRSYKPQFVMGAGMRVTMPTGRYESDRLINIGTNRWRISPEIGMSKRIKRWWLEASAGASFYTDNDDYLGGNKREQDPIYNVQGHVIYGFGRGVWLALDGNYFVGGATTLNGVENDDDFRNSRWGLTLSIPISKRHSVKFYGLTGVIARENAEEATTFGLAYQYGWGKDFPR